MNVVSYLYGVGTTVLGLLVGSYLLGYYEGWRDR